MTTTHELKIWPQHFAAVEQNELTFQIRDNDRKYQPGDVLILKEFEPNSDDPRMHPDGRFTGREIKRQVNRVFERFPGMVGGFVALSIRPVIER